MEKDRDGNYPYMDEKDSLLYDRALANEFGKPASRIIRLLLERLANACRNAHAASPY